MDMKNAIQTVMAIPISETIGRAFGSDTMLGTGATIVTARFVLRSFAGMLALGALAGGLRYMQHRKADPTGPQPEEARKPRKKAPRRAGAQAKPARA
jgi:hypothetical protein